MRLTLAIQTRMMANLARARDAALDYTRCQVLIHVAATLIGAQYAAGALLWHHRPVGYVTLAH